MNGFDVSHWQGKRGVATWVNKVEGAKFVIIKATEGATYVDPSWEQNAIDARQCKLMLGFYHYARPDRGNSAKVEAAHFVSTVREYIGTAVLVLDYEGNAHKYGQAWAKEFLDTVYDMTGVRPMIYLSGSMVKDYKEIAEANYGLWIAVWNSESKMKSYLTGWNIWAMWQHTSTPVDMDKFNGTEGQFLMYAAVDEDWLQQEEELDKTVGCHCKCCGCCAGEDN